MAYNLASAKRLVVKVGSALLVDANNQLRQTWLAGFLADVAACQQRGQKVVIVSSGAIALGQGPLGKAPSCLAESQAAAAIGQIQLAQAYQTGLAQHAIAVSQLLLTLEDSESRSRYLNARNTLATLLKYQVIPVINENDSVATAEIRYGDNDRLAARVAQMIDADALVLLSDIDGLYTADPKVDPTATLVSEIDTLDAGVLSFAKDSASTFGSGGMKTKLAAAKIVMSAGCHMAIVKGDQPHPILQLEQGASCSWFLPKTTPTQARKQWLRHHLNLTGELVIDEGAVAALKQGRSLLTIGVQQVEGHFKKGECIKVVDTHQQIIAHGLSHYSAEDARKIAGLHSSKIEQILGYQAGHEMIHRNDMVLLDETSTAGDKPSAVVSKS